MSKIISLSHYNALKGTFDFLPHIKTRKPWVYLHLMIGSETVAFHWVKKVPSYDQWHCQRAAKHNPKQSQAASAPWSSFPSSFPPQNEVKLQKERIKLQHYIWQMIKFYAQCKTNYFTSFVEWTAPLSANNFTEQDDFGSHRTQETDTTKHRTQETVKATPPFDMLLAMIQPFACHSDSADSQTSHSAVAFNPGGTSSW